MISKTIINDDITIYDNVLNWEAQYTLHEICKNAYYKIGWSDTPNNKENFMHSAIDGKRWIDYFDTNKPVDLSHPQLRTIDILNNSQPFRDLAYDLNYKNGVSKTVINCDTISDSHYQHNHIGDIVILYYTNLEWKDGWGGETKFYDQYGKNIIYTSPYTPNRMIVFDGKVVHSFNPPSCAASKYRFSMSTFINKPRD